MTDTNRDGEYTPMGEGSGTESTFGADEIARSFGVEVDRVHNAITGEFGSSDQAIDSRRAQHLAEVLLGDKPQDEIMAALMNLGAYTPRPDHVEGLGEKDPADESDKLDGDINEIEDTP